MATQLPCLVWAMELPPDDESGPTIPVSGYLETPQRKVTSMIVKEESLCHVPLNIPWRCQFCAVNADPLNMNHNQTSHRPKYVVIFFYIFCFGVGLHLLAVGGWGYPQKNQWPFASQENGFNLIWVFSGSDNYLFSLNFDGIKRTNVFQDSTWSFSGQGQSSGKPFVVQPSSSWVAGCEWMMSGEIPVAPYWSGWLACLQNTKGCYPISFNRGGTWYCSKCFFPKFNGQFKAQHGQAISMMFEL